MANSYRFSSLLLPMLIVQMLARSCTGFGTFGFDIHHRYSDPVKGVLAVDELPEEGSIQYYAVMAHRDKIVHGRRLATASGETTPLTFFNGNDTYRMSSLGYLHYANVSIGTPSLWYLVALDTGSNLLWLPCDCNSSTCVQSLESSSETIKLNIYSPSKSSTSEKVTCKSNLCTQSQSNRCPSAQSSCPYAVSYLSNGTSSSGIYVEDVLHLIGDDTRSKPVDARISFGCGQIQTGSFLDGAAPNGLFGLGMDNISVPSTLAREGYVSNSFSMCFGPDGIGRISFGDKGSSDQAETPFNLGDRVSRSIYNISISQTTVGGTDVGLEFSVIFDSGTSFTYLNDPAYSAVSENFNKEVKEKRHSSISDLPFEYCYDISPKQTDIAIPIMSLVMKGGDYFNITHPIIIVALPGDAYVYCLGLVRSGDVNIIGQNFMTGYRIIFDRERQILGWKPSNCYDSVDSNTLPISPRGSAVPSASAVNPEATAGSGDNPRMSGSSSYAEKDAIHLNMIASVLTIVLIPFFAIV